MDTTTRNRLYRFVTDARVLLVREFESQLEGVYGIQPSEGVLQPLERFAHLSDADYNTAVRLRERIEHLEAAESGKAPRKSAIHRALREQAFTVLNRFAALRMGEARGLVEDCVKGGLQSRGVQLYKQVAGSGLGDAYTLYRSFLECLFDEWAVDLGALFDRYGSTSLLFPREPALKELLDLFNQPELETVWSEDETIGWIYQYYNDKDERAAMRKASSAPRNSRELAVRNQFFTPRYVVEFLLDNTLGRIWYEMTQGATRLADYCRYRVRHADEVFLASPESPAAEAGQDWLLGGRPEFPVTAHHLAGVVRAGRAEASAVNIENGDVASETSTQALLETVSGDARDGRSVDRVLEELRHRLYPDDPEAETPLVVPHRAMKDPREMRLLDPACGSMHFGLYAYDLFEQIYLEAWEHHRGDLPDLEEAYGGDRDAYERDVPRLIVENNLYGIDIDQRAAQIAALALWLRAQRSWNEAGVVPANRPPIRRSNVVCAEPMPGENDLLAAFAAKLEPPVLGELVEEVWAKMELAGEAGSLLKIDQDLQKAIAGARAAYEDWDMGQQREGSDLFGDDGGGRFGGRRLRQRFWEQAESRVLKQVRAFGEGQGRYGSKLFADDTIRGFAFIDVIRTRFDVVVMNPPFGAVSKGSKAYIGKRYPRTKNDLYAAFVERGLELLNSRGMLGAITSRTGFFLSSFQKWREEILLREARLTVMADLGYGVMDEAMVEAAAYCLEAQ